MAPRGTVQLEMKSKLRHGKSYAGLAAVGNMIQKCHIPPMIEVQGRYSKTSEGDQVNPGHFVRLGSSRPGPGLWEVVLMANEAGSWNPQIDWNTGQDFPHRWASNI